MKLLAGKKCHNCGGTRIVIAAEGQVLLIRCLSCKNHSICCPEPNCSGYMRDKRLAFEEQQCNKCDYHTTYVASPPPRGEQAPMFV